MFNSLFPLPHQNMWTVFHPTNNIFMRVISVLRIEDSMLDEWRRIPRIGQYTGNIGQPTSSLWEWTRFSNIPHTLNVSDSSPALQHERGLVISAEENK